MHVPLSSDAQRNAERVMVEEYLAGFCSERTRYLPPSAPLLRIPAPPSHLSPWSSLWCALCVYAHPPNSQSRRATDPLDTLSYIGAPHHGGARAVLLPEHAQQRLVSGEITATVSTYFVTPTRCAVAQVPLLARLQRHLHSRSCPLHCAPNLRARARSCSGPLRALACAGAPHSCTNRNVLFPASTPAQLTELG